MNTTETIFLVMADAARRADCFGALALHPRRIVRGFADAREAAEAVDDSNAACMVIDPAGLAASAVEYLLRRVACQPALVTIFLADQIDMRIALALVRTYPVDIMPHASSREAVAERATLLLPLAAQRHAHWRDHHNAERALARLSPREATVLAALAIGQTSKDIARTLGVSPRTVEVHRASIMRRTDTATLADLLRLYFCVTYGGARNAAQISSIAA